MQVALAWLLHRSQNILLIPGTSLQVITSSKLLGWASPQPRSAAFARCHRAIAGCEMCEIHIIKIAGELKVQPRQVAATAKLFAEGATVASLDEGGAAYRGRGPQQNPVGSQATETSPGASQTAHNGLVHGGA